MEAERIFVDAEFGEGCSRIRLGEVEYIHVIIEKLAAMAVGRFWANRDRNEGNAYHCRDEVINSCNLTSQINSLTALLGLGLSSIGIYYSTVSSSAKSEYP